MVKGNPYRRPMKIANKQAQNVLNTGNDLAKGIAPELFDKGLDRQNFDDYNKYLDPSVSQAQGRLGETEADFANLVAKREAGLGGLLSDENTALREQAYGELDAQSGAALDNAQRRRVAEGTGAGAGFLQDRVINRDAGQAAAGLESKILLDNVGVKNQALNAFEGTLGAKNAALTSADANIAGLKGQQASTLAAVNSANAQAQKDEIAAKAAAQAAGVGILKDQQDRLDAAKKFKQAMRFAKEQDRARLEALMGL